MTHARVSAAPGRDARRAFFAVVALLFAASVGATVAVRGSMSAMVPAAWMGMCGQSWLDAAVEFLAMWGAMTAAMMLPSLAPALWRYRRAGGSAALAGAGYLLVWMLIGAAAYPAGVALAATVMRHPALARAVPAVSGLVVLLGGAFQFTRWKAHHLACCRSVPASPSGGLRYGLRLGLHCGACCAGVTAALLAVGIMDLGVMALAAAAITLERLAPTGERVARAVGVVMIVAGIYLAVQTVSI